ncbi:MAG: hypothetical protein WDZ45_08865 [Flavobacteriaceae bacterium]
MNTASLVFGILAILGMMVGFIPCLGALNWINIPFAFIGLIISIIALSNRQQEGKSNNGALAGLIMCLCAMFFGLFRLFLGGGIL